MFNVIPASIEYIRASKLRALAVTSAVRSEALPDVPTVGDFLPGYEASAWFGIGAPKNLPAEIVGRLNREINAGLHDPQIKLRLADLGATALVVRLLSSVSSSPMKPRSGARYPGGEYQGRMRPDVRSGLRAQA
jgi:hypothetical protein